MSAINSSPWQTLLGTGKKRNLFVTILLLGGLVFPVVFLLLFRPGDPSFKGVRLSVWLDQLYEGDTNSPSAAALHKFKPEAVQLITSRLKAQDAPWKLKLIELMRKQSFIRFHFRTAAEKRTQGLAGCRLLGPEACAAIPALSHLLYDTNTTWDGARGLIYVGPDSITPLLGALSASNGRVRHYAAIAIGRIRSERNEPVPALICALGDPQIDVRSAAANALTNCAARLPGVVPALMECLEHATNSESRTWSAVALKNLGSAAKAAVPVLMKTVHDPDWAVSGNSMSALAAIDLDAAVPLLLEWSKEEGSLKPIVAIRHLKQLPKEGSVSVLPAFINCLDHASGLDREQAAEALGDMGAEAREAVPKLLRALGDPDARVRASAGAALKKIDPETAAQSVKD